MKKRLDVLVFELGLAESREKARAIIMGGNVFSNGQRADKPGMTVPHDANIEVRGAALPYVSRGGLKLEKALDVFSVSPEGLICLDCGASTGGFTDCLLKRGASKVYAVDVGYGQLAWALRSDERVVCMERTNIRYVTSDDIPEKIDLAVIDVSFISLKLVLPAVKALIKEDAKLICLIKPQFEAGRDKVGKKGVVREPETHISVLYDFYKNAQNSDFSVNGLTFSPVRGPEGNIEYLGFLIPGAEKDDKTIDVEALVLKSHADLG